MSGWSTACSPRLITASGWRWRGLIWRGMPTPTATTATVWMGLTLRCAQCHNHKYDPLTQRDYYRFYAFFNHVPEKGGNALKGNAVPFIKVPTPEQQVQLETYSQRIAGLEPALKARV